MSVEIKLIQELRERTSLSLNDCKKALEESNSNIDVAIDLLKKWGSLKAQEKATKVANEGIVKTYSNNSRTHIGIVEVNCQTDFLAKSEEFIGLVDTLCDKTSSDQFEAARQELVAKSGENIVLRRQANYARGAHSILTTYDHPGNRLATILEVSCDKWTKELADLCDDLAMQIAASAPQFIAGKDIPQDAYDRQKAIFEEQLRIAKKPEPSWPKIIIGKFQKHLQEICLLNQISIKDNKKTVLDTIQEVEKNLGGTITVVRFERYALGE
jgi:elongation factor Ts